MEEGRNIRPTREERRKWQPSPWHEGYQAPEEESEDKDATLNIKKVHKAAQIIENEYTARKIAHIVAIALLAMLYMGACGEYGNPLFFLDMNAITLIIGIFILFAVHQVVYFIVQAFKDLSNFED